MHFASTSPTVGVRVSFCFATSFSAFRASTLLQIFFRLLPKAQRGPSLGSGGYMRPGEGKWNLGSPVG